MKIKKSTKALAAAASLAMMATVGLSACGGSSNDAETTADGKVKITMWHGFSEADGKTLESIVDDFNKSQDKYEIDAQLQPWSTIGETMVTKVTSGDGPDFVTTGADNGQGWSIDGTFQCVTDFYDDKDSGTDEYIENVVDQITFNIDGSEEKCGVPMGYAPTAVWYNTDMWKAAGLTDADYPQTWDELLEVAKKLTKSDGSQYGIALPDLGWAPFLKGNGSGIYTTDGKVVAKYNYEMPALYGLTALIALETGEKSLFTQSLLLMENSRTFSSSDKNNGAFTTKNSDKAFDQCIALLVYANM